MGKKISTHKEINSAGNFSGILTEKEIKKLKIIRVDGDLAEDSNCYFNASYDFRLGDQYALPSKGQIKENNKDATKTDNQNKERDDILVYSCSKENDVLRIPAFTSVIFSTYEKVLMPDNVSGRFDLRIKWALQGLVLQVGTQIEPGYEGRLFGLIHNFSNKEICIPTKTRFLTAEFAYTSTPAPPKTRKVINDLKTFLTNYNSVEGTLESFLRKIEKTKQEIEDGYKKVLEDNRRRTTVFLAIIIAIVTIAFTVGIPLIVTKFSYDKDDYPIPTIYQLEKMNDSLKYDLIIFNKNYDALKLKYDSINHRIKKLEKK
jgi:deoxycytidine triphosphate deaminase